MTISVTIEFQRQSSFPTSQVAQGPPLMRNAKQKRKKKDPPLGMKLCSLSPFHRKWRDELIYLLNPSGLTGLEPAASALTGRCSDQLNYNPREIRDLAENLILFYLRIGYF